MNKPTLKSILQTAYDRDQWISTLQFLTGNRELLTVNLSPKAIEVNTSEANGLIKSFHQIGNIKTSEEVNLPVFEIILEDTIKIEYNRVGVNEFIKKYIIKDAIKGALATFSYDNNHKKTEWRFSFISKNSASDFFQEAKAEETNPKKYTYIFGNQEEHRTAIERLYNLEQSRFRLEDFFEAFNVEPVSKKFFEEYKQLYREFSNYILDNSEYVSLFEKATDSNVNVQKEVRNFVSRLLGRIVFLYFLQKKNWLGASTTEYNDGSTSFLSDLFTDDPDNRDDFYSKYLCPIFFNALNTPDRKNDEFKLENGKTVCIPFLNGGLFEEEQEPIEHRDIKIPAFHFEMLFNFFDSFNFTVYENSPEEHTVAVDPEMLGHIFENLIDYNKDTGTFYTPKEIVQYMTQESLIEYLNTHLDRERYEIENLIKHQNANQFVDNELTKINQLLDDVKICDPAIGSGAFPMGMLQEIFNLKALINFKLGFEVWSPATVKQNIIQNSIYGVDLDEGAVEIARLRFWLSLVVDEGMPKALPNLDYKIMQGNSLLESYKSIDLSGISSGNDLKIVEEMQKDLWGNLVDNQMKMTVGKSGLTEEIQKLIKKYFTAKASEKRNIKNKIEAKISEHISFNIELRENQLHRRIAELQNAQTTKQKKALEQYQINLEKLEATKIELEKEQIKDEKNYFLWHLFFGNVLNSGGFDIVIGNPPYGVSIKGDYRDSVTKKFGKVPDFEIYYLFIELTNVLIKDKGILSYIIPNTYLFNTFAETYRLNLFNNWNLIEILDCTKFSIFQTATVRNTVNLWQKGTSSFIGYRKTKNQETFKDLISQKRLQLNIDDLLELNQNWGLAFMLDSSVIELVTSIKKDKINLSSLFSEISQGLIAYDKYRGQSAEVISNRIYHFDKFEKDDLKKWLWGEDVTKYKVKWNGKEYIDYCEGIANPRNPKFFMGERLLIREITNPSIFAAITNEELYNDPSILIIKSNESLSVKWLAAILNSKLATFYHFNFSPKATKGAFPKILIKDIKEFPIVVPDNFQPFEILVDYLVFLNNSTQPAINNYAENASIALIFEDVVNLMVYELYFTEHLKELGLDVLKYIDIEQYFKAIDTSENADLAANAKIISECYNWLQMQDNPIRNRILLSNIKSPDIIKRINASTH